MKNSKQVIGRVVAAWLLLGMSYLRADPPDVTPVSEGATKAALDAKANANGANVVPADFRASLGVNPSTTYYYGSHGPFAAFMNSIDAGKDACFQVITDSTNAATDSWTAKVRDKLVSYAPNHRILYGQNSGATLPFTVTQAGPSGERHWYFSDPVVGSITSISSTSTTITVVSPSHGRSPGEYVSMSGCSNASYNTKPVTTWLGWQIASVPDANTFTITDANNFGASTGGQWQSKPEWALYCQKAIGRLSSPVNQRYMTFEAEVSFTAAKLSSGSPVAITYLCGYGGGSKVHYVTLGTDRRVAVIYQNAPVQQVETATFAGQVTTAGDMSVIVTGTGITGSPVTVTVPVKLHDTELGIAQRARNAVAANSAISALYTVGGTNDKLTLTKTTPGANVSDLNIEIANGTAAGITPAATSANTQAGYDQVYSFPTGSPAMPALTADTKYRIRVEIDAGTGGAASTATYSYSTNSGASWTTLGTPQNGLVCPNGLADPAATPGGNWSYWIGGVGGLPTNGTRYYDANFYYGSDKQAILPSELTIFHHGDGQFANQALLSGSPTIRIINIALPGSGLANMISPLDGISTTQTLQPNISTFVRDYGQSFIIVASQHNDVSENPGSWARKADVLIGSLNERFSPSTKPAIVIMTENPEVEGSGTAGYGMARQHNDRVPNIIQYAYARGYGLIDVFRAFREDGRPLYPTLVGNPPGSADRIHPTPAGNTLWADTVWRHAFLASKNRTE